MKKESIVGVRLTNEELALLDQHTQGGLSRSQIVHVLIKEFLSRPDKEQRELLIKWLLLSGKK